MVFAHPAHQRFGRFIADRLDVLAALAGPVAGELGEPGEYLALDPVGAELRSDRLREFFGVALAHRVVPFRAVQIVGGHHRREPVCEPFCAALARNMPRENTGRG